VKVWVLEAVMVGRIVFEGRGHGGGGAWEEGEQGGAWQERSG
jgi:hypothetical protein